MEIIILKSMMTVANFIYIFWMYEKKNYKTAVLNGIASGACFMGLLNAL